MIDPPSWTNEELEADRRTAIELFRMERLQEPLGAYLDEFDRYLGIVEELLARTADLTRLQDVALDVLSDRGFLQAFRYLSGPPVSEDDLKSLADAASLSPSRLRGDSAAVERILQVVRDALDRRRFPWVIENRAPTSTERSGAVLASAALLAMRRTETRRRMEGKRSQHEVVAEALRNAGLEEVDPRAILTLSAAPGRGEFCGESSLGGREADFVVGLWDGRTMPIEAKVSNSSINSIKRLNNDATVKAEVWREDFGRLPVVPAAVITGVFSMGSLSDAQNRGLTIFWAHQIEALTSWVVRTQV